MIESFKLKVFCEVADNLKYRRAADELHSTQPAVTAQIRSLEDSLGIAPFDRVGRETTLAAAPECTLASFFRTAAGAEIDLLLEIPAHGLWAIEIKRSLSGRPGKGFYIACEGLRPDRRFVVNSGKGNYPIDSEITAIRVHELAEMLVDLSK